jgi:hypothetical protein
VTDDLARQILDHLAVAGAMAGQACEGDEHTGVQYQPEV